MTQIYSWEDSFDRETADKSGNFCLYRNYCFKNNNGEFSYEYMQLPGTSNWNPLLYQTNPVAKGITVYYCNSLFLEKSLYELLSENAIFSTINIYEIYFEKLFTIFLIKYNSRPIPIPQNEVECIFLSHHLKEENASFQESEKYYSECVGEDDREIKSRIKDFVDGYLLWVNRKIANLALQTYPSTPMNKFNRETSTLFDIWEGDINEYDKVIEILLENNLSIDGALVTNNNGQLRLNIGIRGIYQYLAGFTYTLIKNQLILNTYNAPDYSEIYWNTFHVRFDIKPFKSISTNPPKEKYLLPFINIVPKK